MEARAKEECFEPMAEVLHDSKLFWISLTDYLIFFDYTHINPTSQALVNRGYEMSSVCDEQSAGIHEFSTFKFEISTQPRQQEFALITINQSNEKHSVSSRFKHAPCKIMVVQVLERDEKEFSELVYIDGKYS